MDGVSGSVTLLSTLSGIVLQMALVVVLHCYLECQG